MDNHIVHLKHQFCTCGFFQLCGYPCCHALACISYHRLNVEDYKHEYFKKDMYLRVYQHMIYPVPGMHDFEDTGKGEVGPPNIKQRRGRPTKKRRDDGNDTNHSKASRRGLTHTCKICGTLGHNK
ncbi:unnamed protein product [Cuscuta europaea]|uniref:SWIM-type domain-containing protein n=1 Tax=Cuscuta europaea TaxID=41803 RepID=A0A9P0ZV74_CUSEU|nr:unnamed protein product [Cuscuta europaea]